MKKVIVALFVFIGTTNFIGVVYSSNATNFINISIPSNIANLYASGFVSEKSDLSSESLAKVKDDLSDFDESNFAEKERNFYNALYNAFLTTPKFKGILRLSWSFDIKHNKNIDLVFFIENNDLLNTPQTNFALLYAKDFPKRLDTYTYSIPRLLSDIKIPYNINYDFAKKILSKTDLSNSQQKRFLDSRFGAVFVPVEIEFEWFVVELSIENEAPFDFSVISLPKYDKYIKIIDDDNMPIEGKTMLLGIIKSYKILPQNTALNFHKSIFFLNEIYQPSKKRPNEIFHPLPTSALAITKTNINDFIVNIDDFIINLRDKPDSQKGKIIAQLFLHKASISLLQCDNTLNKHTCEIDIGKMEIKYYKTQQKYYESNKSKLINPLSRGDYLVLIWDILPNDWCKVWVLKMPNNAISSEDSEITFNVKELEKLDRFDFWDVINPFLSGSYADTFNNSPSKLKLYEGYIHSNDLEYLAPFGNSYID